MPNGRSGGFPIETADLKRLIRAVSNTAAIGKVVDGSSGPSLRPADAAEVTRLVEECAHQRVAVEEQDHKFYIIHIRDEPTPIWVAVHSESPIFDELKQRHAQWNIEHPNWTGWIGF